MPKLQDGDFPESARSAVQGPKLRSGQQPDSLSTVKLSSGFQADQLRINAITRVEETTGQDAFLFKDVVTTSAKIEESSTEDTSEQTVQESTDEATEEQQQQEYESYQIKGIAPDDDSDDDDTSYGGDTYTPPSEQEGYEIKGIAP